MSHTNEGVTWQEGEERVAELARQAGTDAYPTRGPVLWAMRRIKFERFAERTRPDEQFARSLAAVELDGDACSLWALLRRDPRAIQRREVRDAMERAGWPPDVVAELRSNERLSRSIPRAGTTWEWSPTDCEWRETRRRQVSLF